MTSQQADPDWLDAIYNNRARVPEHPAYFARWATDSAQVRDTQPCELDVAYGDGVNETLDIFPAAENKSPVLVFIHGGYWRSLDKSDHSFLAPVFASEGVCVVIPNYALCPGSLEKPVGVGDITTQMVSALKWTAKHIANYGGDPERITVIGHSAGGQLAAMLLAHDWASDGLAAPPLRSALSMSGLYDLHPIMQTPSLQSVLRLTEAEVRSVSPALRPVPAQGVLYTVVGEKESEEFLRHNLLIRQRWGPQRVPVCEALPGHDHFSIVDALSDPSQQLHRHAMRLLKEP